MPIQVPVTIVTAVCAAAAAQLLSRLLNEAQAQGVAMICQAGDSQGEVNRFYRADNGCITCTTGHRADALGELVSLIANAEVRIERVIFDATGLDAAYLCELFLSGPIASSPLMPDVVIAALDIGSIASPDEGKSMAGTLIEQADTVLIMASATASARRKRSVVRQVKAWNHTVGIRILCAAPAPLSSILNLSARLESRPQFQMIPA